MISCTDFIPAYSDLFRFLEKRGGKEAVIRFWHDLSDQFLDNLRETVKKEGLQGCWTYWSRTLNEEAADFKMELDLKKGVFKGILRKCPSKGRLMKLKHFKAYPDYCGHCDVLYRRVLEPLGYEFYLDMSACDRATCRFFVLRKKGTRSGVGRGRAVSDRPHNSGNGGGRIQPSDPSPKSKSPMVA